MSIEKAHTQLPAVSHPAFAGVIGIARRDITPPIGIYARNWGAALHETAEGIHRPLTATAVTLQTSEDSVPAIILALDLGWWRSFHDEWYVRKYLLDALNIDSRRVMICLSHTHAGPVICRADVDKPGGELIGPYLDSVRQTLVDVVKEALASAGPGRLEWRYGACGLAKNRDLKDPDSHRYLCGYNPEGQADDTLLVGRITDDAGLMRGVIVNYACHPTTLAWENKLISPDFVGSMRELVEQTTGSGICLYLHGASGELAPAHQYTADTEVVDGHGRELGYAVLSTIAGMAAPDTQLRYAGAEESGAPLAVWRKQAQSDAASDRLVCHQIDVEYRLQEMPILEALDALIRGCSDRVTVERLTRKRRIREALGSKETAHVPAWIWEVGGAVLIGHPNEAYSELQQEVRRAFPDRAIGVMNVVNGHFGYLPPTDLYREDIYPVWQTPFGPGGLEHLIETCIHRIETF